MISHHNIHHTGQAADQDSVKEGEEVPLGGDGGPEEAGEGDAAEIGDGQGEEGEQAPHCTHHLLLLLSYLVLNLSCF